MNTRTGMPGVFAFTLWVLLLLGASSLQAVYAARLAFWGGYPDFPLTVALCAALLSDASVGCVTGFGAGLVMASVCGRTLGTFLISRTIAGYLAGLLTNRLFRGNLGVVFLGVWGASVAAEVIYGLAAPRLTLMHWVYSTLIGATMNAFLALPITLLLRRFGWGQGRV